MSQRNVLIRASRRWLEVSIVLAVLGFVLAPMTVIASHQFADVSDNNLFHSDIAWVAANGVTRGCNPPTVVDGYAPDCGIADLRCDDNGKVMTAGWTRITAIGFDALTNNGG